MHDYNKPIISKQMLAYFFVFHAVSKKIIVFILVLIRLLM